jgi:hypothetical protein
MMRPRHARLIGALLAGQETVTAQGLAVLDQADWAKLLWLAGEDLLTPEIAAPLAAPCLAALVPPEVAQHVAELRSLNAARNARIAAQVAELTPAFAGAGLCPLLLKGVRVFADPEPESPDRVMGDLDLLFPPDAVALAATVLERLGYHRLADDAGLHSVGYFARPGEPAPVDLHRTPIRPSHLLSAAELFARAHRATAFGAPVLIADPVDEVLLRALHETLHHHAFRHGLASLRALRSIAVRLPRLNQTGWAELRARSAGRSLVPLATAIRLISDVFGPAAIGREGAVLARNVFARAAAWRTWAKAAAALPRAVDAVWDIAADGLGAYEHRPGLDGSVAMWRVRRFARPIRRAFSQAASSSRAATGSIQAPASDPSATAAESHGGMPTLGR